MAIDTALKTLPRPQVRSIFQRAKDRCAEDGAAMFWSVLVERNGKVERLCGAVETDWGEILFEAPVPARARIMLVHDHQRRS